MTGGAREVKERALRAQAIARIRETDDEV